MTPNYEIELLITQMQLEHRLSALLQLHLRSRLNTWLQWFGQRQLQDKTWIIQVLGLGVTYIRDFTVNTILYEILLVEALSDMAYYIDDLVQACSNSCALAMELLQSCAESSILRFPLRDLMLKPAGPWMDPYFHLSIHCILIVFYCGGRGDLTTAKY